ncbi:conserved exported protein of unknown function [Tenacibaculum sp. 190130A14a]|uniref:Lipoprotein n=1 Tax=Tenacibaculum polynesiense TaxID=3137857 RepID=A0ABM9P7J1_9FLAO
MKTFTKVLAVVMILGFVSCTDNTEETEIQLNEQQELFGINKNDSTTPGSDGGEDPDNGEE